MGWTRLTEHLIVGSEMPSSACNRCSASGPQPWFAHFSPQSRGDRKTASAFSWSAPAQLIGRGRNSYDFQGTNSWRSTQFGDWDFSGECSLPTDWDQHVFQILWNITDESKKPIDRKYVERSRPSLPMRFKLLCVGASEPRIEALDLDRTDDEVHRMNLNQFLIVCSLADLPCFLPLYRNFDCCNLCTSAQMLHIHVEWLPY